MCSSSTLGCEAIEELEHFANLSSVVDTHGREKQWKPESIRQGWSFSNSRAFGHVVLPWKLSLRNWVSELLSFEKLTFGLNWTVFLLISERIVGEQQQDIAAPVTFALLFNFAERCLCFKCWHSYWTTGFERCRKKISYISGVNVMNLLDGRCHLNCNWS